MRKLHGWDQALFMVFCAPHNYIRVSQKRLNERRNTMFEPIRRFARALRVPSVQEREMAYLNSSRDRFDLEYRQQQIDRGLFRSGR